MNKMIQRVCTIKSCQEIALKTFLIQFVSPEIATMSRPGQFVNVLSAEFGEGPLLRRPFSISRIDGDVVEILFHTVGEGTELLSKKKSGDTVDVIGPLGQSFRTDTDHAAALIIAGGIGVAPFPFLTSELLKTHKHIETFVGFRNARQVYTQYLDNVHIATDDGSNGFHGNVVQLFEQSLRHHAYSNAKIFACGPTIMLKALKKVAMEKNICCEMSLEGQMACGIGICQGCPVERIGEGSQYALVCKDGPTFMTTEINL